MNKFWINLGSICGALMAILTLVGFIGEPFLEDYVNSRIEGYEEKRRIEESNKVPLRKLLSDKMGVADDEVHIELGKAYKKIIEEDIEKLKEFDVKVKKEIGYYHPDNLLNE